MTDSPPTPVSRPEPNWFRPQFLQQVIDERINETKEET